MNVCQSSHEMQNVLVELLQGPKYPNQDFVCHKASFADVYDMASSFYRIFTTSEDKTLPIALVAEEKAVIAAALLAALASGVVLALPHSFSQTALQQMQDVTGFTTAIVDHELKQQKTGLPQNTQLIAFEPGAEKDMLPVTNVSVDRELLTLFTGGSTGVPKKWSKSANNIFGEALYMADRYQINETDTIAATVSPYHIYGLLFSVIIPLVSSARVLGETPSFPAEIVTLVQQESVTVLVSVPAHYRVLKGRPLKDSLQRAFSSAGMLNKEDSLDFFRCNSVGVVEVYGSTETGGLATRNRAAEQEVFHPLNPIEWQIKEERLYVRSPFLSPDLVTDPDGFFLSGDRVQRHGDEGFSLHGRADAVTKVGGVRVDLDEVRDLVQQQPNVKECVVVSLAEESGRGNRIAAMIRGDAVDVSEIHETLSHLLEPAALPKCIKVVSVIPIRSNGKHDRKAIIDLLSAS